MVYNWLEKLQHSTFPTSCRLCRAPGEPGIELCVPCRRELPWLTRACRRCALPLPPESNATTCSNCQKSPSPLAECRALFTYQPPVDGWIQKLKFDQDLAAARLLGALLARSLQREVGAASVALLPVPLHRRRLSERGYNQAMEIARPLARCGYRVETRCCTRIRDTGAQSGLPATARRGNMRGAFSVCRPVSGQHFVIIDDVLTTGSTLKELARALTAAGADSVRAWVIARAVLNRKGADAASAPL